MSNESGEDDSYYDSGRETEKETLDLGKEMSKRKKSRKREERDRTGKTR